MRSTLLGLVVLVVLLQCSQFSSAEEVQQPLQILGITLDEQALMTAHQTSMYRGADGKPQTTWLILRRGRNIVGTVKTNGKLPSGWQTRFCFLEIRDDPNASPNKFCDTNKFTATGDGSEQQVTFTPSYLTPVGKYRLIAQVVDGSNVIKGLTYEPNRKDRNVAVLVDPYSPKEPMYTNNTNFIAEFLHNERGAFWVGTSYDYQFRPWTYDHFNIEVFETVINLVTKHVSPLERKDPIALARAVAGLPRNPKETVLVGKWDPPYDDGVFPPAWLSSFDIFKMFRDKKTAKYGQCMIFAAFTTTWFRTLGYPARPITIYDFATVASDKNEVNMYWDISADGKYYTAAKNNSDKLWGFHAVTEILLKRKDDTEATWNVVDGTWKSGPMQVSKFKANDAKAEYDTAAYLKAMNSVVTYYNQNPVTKKYDDIRKSPIQLASKIFTKGWDEGCKVQFNDAKEYTSLCFQDLVANYKPVAAARFRSLHKGPADAGWQTTDSGSWTFKTFVSTSKRVGESIGAKMTIKKKMESAAALKTLTITATFVEYTGAPLGEPFEVKSVSVAGDSQSVELNLESPEFWRKALATLKTTQNIRFAFHAFSVQGAVMHFETRTYVMQLPKLTMLGPNTIKKGNKISCNVMFSNPFPFALGEASLQVRISGDATDEFFTRTVPNVPAKTAGAAPASYRVTFDNVQVKAMVPGPHWIMGSLTFKEVNQQMPVFGLNDLTVTDN